MAIALTTCVLAGCDVHEYPDSPDKVTFYLRLNYETDFPVWEQTYETRSEAGTKDVQHTGTMRYIVRAYPQSDELSATLEHIYENTFTRDIADGYDYGLPIELEPGNYDIRVWADLLPLGENTRYYNADNFAGISLQGEYQGNNDYRDAFRGTGTVSLEADIMERVPDTLDISMVRPLAKYEFITNDLTEFIAKEQTRAQTKSDGAETKVSIDDYRVVFYYVGFMPDTYSLLTDRPVDSATGIQFVSRLNRLNETEASIGFDYVFVNGIQSAVTVQIGIYDTEDTLLSLTDPIEVPLKRSHHTVMRGSFLMSEVSGGIGIEPGFDGDYNITFP